MSLAVTAVVTGATLVAPVAAQSSGPQECAPAMPTSEVTKGMFGTGYTVSRGTVPERFSVEVVGVMPDGIGPGRDMIVVEASSPAIVEAGGIWYGMSGSPVFVDGRLIGALAYGLAWGPSTVAGLTPAEDIVKLADRPAADAAEGSETISLTPRMVRQVAAAAGVSPADVSDEMSRLKSPISVSGLGTRGMREVAKTVRREGLPFVPYAGGSASTASAPAEHPVRGGNFAAAISYGDVTFAGIGTTTYVCEGKVVAFGHPFFFFPEGETRLGANTAEALTVVKDPSFGSYKLATIGGTFGTLDQDRFAGVRALLGAAPSSSSISSMIRVAGGDERSGQTDVLRQDYLPFLALIHTLSNMDFTLDKIGDGSAQLEWTVSGTRADGSPWSLTRINMFSSPFDIAYESLNEMSEFLYMLAFNGLEEVALGPIDVDATMVEEERYHTISRVLVAKNGGEFRERKRMRAKPGAVLTARVFLESLDGAEDVTYDLTVQIPTRARRTQRLKLRGASFGYFDEYYCLSEYEDCDGEMGSKIESFDDLLSSLAARDHNNDLVAELRGGRGRVRSKEVAPTDQVVRGSKTIEIELRLPRRR